MATRAATLAGIITPPGFTAPADGWAVARGPGRLPGVPASRPGGSRAGPAAPSLPALTWTGCGTIWFPSSRCDLAGLVGSYAALTGAGQPL